MEKSAANTEGQKLSDVAMARDYVAAIGGTGSVKTILHRAYSTLAEMFPHRDNPPFQWTERRVRGFWTMDAATVQFREMLELHRAAEKAKSERELLMAARKEHAAFIAKTASLAALLEHQDEAFHSPQLEALRGQSGGMDLPGTQRGE